MVEFLVVSYPRPDAVASAAAEREAKLVEEGVLPSFPFSEIINFRFNAADLRYRPKLPNHPPEMCGHNRSLAVDIGWWNTVIGEVTCPEGMSRLKLGQTHRDFFRAIDRAFDDSPFSVPRVWRLQERINNAATSADRAQLLALLATFTRRAKPVYDALIRAGYTDTDLGGMRLIRATT